MSKIVLDQKKVSDIEGKFFVASYQRGYRWGDDEVRRLLDDIKSFGELAKNSDYYCLQPIVIRRVVKDGENMYELIDGQQRLTTLFLLYKYFHYSFPQEFLPPKFSLRYQTRENSAEFLDNLSLEPTYEKLKEENVDFFHIFNAYRQIDKWFDPKDTSRRKTTIESILSSRVKVIWYEVDEKEDPIKLYTRLNIGKIPLTSAELVKAVFLSDGIDRNRGNNDSKQQEIALLWDNIERELNNERLWYFLTNEPPQNYPTKIDLILDLLASKASKAEEPKDKYHTFFYFYEQAKSKGLDLWEEIYKTFIILKDWYEDHNLYHKIGYLLASRKYSLIDIFKSSEKKSKTEFEKIIDEMIRESVKFDKSYGDLSYETDKQEIERFLLLFNVESVRSNAEETLWFPFNKHKGNKWSLEHIHAQQSERLAKTKDRLEWIRLHLDSIRTLSGHIELRSNPDKNQIEEVNELIEKMESYYNKGKVSGNDFEALQRQVFALFSENGKTEYLHSISNMALLSCADNAALSNSTFDVKRTKIIEKDKKGEYIPFCTKNVFFKYYSNSGSSQIHFWGEKDRESYVEHINDVLKDYLMK